ncbi:unnamed protein product [Echinostoma caproni]|uniref:Pinin n=1 Tax=Echinostoma caproni TaxID=27848 RepID=A0A183ABL6_9TREM|nr:unnamed protein product [Echinostoma caproni]
MLVEADVLRLVQDFFWYSKVNLKDTEQQPTAVGQAVADDLQPSNVTEHEALSPELGELEAKHETDDTSSEDSEDEKVFEQEDNEETSDSKDAEFTEPVKRSTEATVTPALLTELNKFQMPITEKIIEGATDKRQSFKQDVTVILNLLEQLLVKLDVPPLNWNTYHYITALKGPDGSIYLPKHHQQSTRKHLATLLGTEGEAPHATSKASESSDEVRQTGTTVLTKETSSATQPLLTKNPQVPEHTISATQNQTEPQTETDSILERAPENSEEEEVMETDEHEQPIEHSVSTEAVTDDEYEEPNLDNSQPTEESTENTYEFEMEV